MKVKGIRIYNGRTIPMEVDILPSKTSFPITACFSGREIRGYDSKIPELKMRHKSNFNNRIKINTFIFKALDSNIDIFIVNNGMCSVSNETDINISKIGWALYEVEDDNISSKNLRKIINEL